MDFLSLLNLKGKQGTKVRALLAYNVAIDKGPMVDSVGEKNGCPR